MGCNCKNGTSMSDLTNNGKPLSLFQEVIKWTLKILLFAIMMAAMPVIILAVIYFIFSTVVLNTKVDIKPLLLALGKRFKSIDYDEMDDEEFEELTEDDVELTDVEVLK